MDVVAFSINVYVCGHIFLLDLYSINKQAALLIINLCCQVTEAMSSCFL